MQLSEKSNSNSAVPGLSRLLALAAAIPAASTSALAEGPAATPELKISYFNYEDSQGSGEDRVTIGSPMLFARVPVGEEWEVEGTFQIDDITGASPWYLDSLSGASGLGIDEVRRLGDIRVTKRFERYSISLGGALSTEDDYISRSASLEGRWWTDDKNTTITVGLSPSWDRITSSNNSTLLERRTTYAWLAGVTQVLTPNSIIQSNLFYQNADGYLSDQYKYFDHRPQSRDEYGWVVRYNHYIESLDAALHADYRLLMDSWDMASHTVQVKWYQPLGESVILRPMVRFYTQNKAEYFSSEFPPTDFEAIYSADQRLSGFGGLSYGAKLEISLGESFTLDGLVEFIEQRGSWQLFGTGTDGLKPFHARFTGVGITARF